VQFEQHAVRRRQEHREFADKHEPNGVGQSRIRAKSIVMTVGVPHPICSSGPNT
jgi:hypothetical protein